ncbi:MAG: DUF1697 domain-containing protein [Rhodobacteraceae bacterium]|nr:DUF1697 domain-containing protein [Paracoccaceae bacterium]
MKSVILLRGINVGGHGKLPMKELCELLEGLGAANPRSYIQSGNVVIEGDVDAEAVEDAVEASKGFRPRVLVMPANAFLDIAVQTPFEEPDGKFLHIWFASTAFTFDQEKADSLRAESEALHIGAQAIYLHALKGIGRSKLAEKIERLAGVPCTARNMNTVRKLLEMLDA